MNNNNNNTTPNAKNIYIRLKQIKSYTTLPTILPEELNNTVLSTFYNTTFNPKNILHILATLKLIELLSLETPPQPIKDNSLPITTPTYQLAVDLIKSNNPPSSVEELIEKTKMSETLLFSYIATDGIFKSWYRVVTDKNTAKVFENITKQALKENYDNQEEHSYKASSLVLNSNKDFIKKTTNELIEEKKEDIANLLKSIKDNIITPNNTTIIDITPNNNSTTK